MAETSNATAPSKCVWIITGESSGDVYGARVAEALKRLDSQIRIQGMGGAEMAARGVDLLVDSSQMGVVGFVEVLRQIGLFRRCLQYLGEKAREEQPDVVVLIDFPGFNLRLAERLKELSVKVVYYISPQVWAWRKGRIRKIARLVDRMLVIFPFEKETYSGTALPVTFVGHPLVPLLAEQKEPEVERDRGTILLLPGSRKSEVKRIFPLLLKTAVWLQQRHPGVRFVTPLPSEELRNLAQKQVDKGVYGQSLNIDIVQGQEAKYWMQKACCGIAASGTVTMEAAILGLPLVVVYRVHPVTYLLGQLMVDVPYVTIVNLVAEKVIFEEFLQGEARPDKVGTALEAVFPDGERRAEVEKDMRNVIEKLGERQKVCENVARIVIEEADNSGSDEEESP